MIEHLLRVTNIRSARVVGALLLGGLSGTVRAQSPPCAAGRLVKVDVVSHSLFAPADIANRRFSPLWAAVNRAHFHTRPSYVRSTLLIGEGDCYDPELVAASVRVLRDRAFIARVEARPTRVSDSTWALSVETWDEWSTLSTIDVVVDRRVDLRALSITEINAAGRGLSVSGSHWNYRERVEQSASIGTSHLFGTRAEAQLRVGKSRTGSLIVQRVEHPFLSETDRLSVSIEGGYEDFVRPWSTGATRGITNVMLPLRDRHGSVSVVQRFGEPGALRVFGAEVQALRRMVSGGPLQVENGDFGDASPAADSIVGRLGRHLVPVSYLKIGPIFGLRRIRFTERRGLDLVTGTQDVALGIDAKAALGRVVTAWGTDGPGTYGWVDAFASGARGGLLANAQVKGEARYLDAPSSTSSRWRDVQLNGDARLYARAGGVPWHTLSLGAHVRLRHNMDQPWQGSLGREDALRGFHNDALPTGSTVTGSVEERVNLPVIHPAVDLGFTAFGDVGRGWAGDVPFALQTGWRGSVGGGIRAGFPAGTGAIVRLELAWPVGEHREPGPVFRAYWSVIKTSR